MHFIENASSKLKIYSTYYLDTMVNIISKKDNKKT